MNDKNSIVKGRAKREKPEEQGSPRQKQTEKLK